MEYNISVLFHYGYMHVNHTRCSFCYGITPIINIFNFIKCISMIVLSFFPTPTIFIFCMFMLQIFMVSIVISLLYLDEISANLPLNLSESCSGHSEHLPHKTSCDGGNKNLISFMGLLLELLRRNLPVAVTEVGNLLNSTVETAGRQVLEWRIAKSLHFIEDWEWRLSILDRLQPLSECQWGWKEALVIFRAAPSKLLNL